MACFGFESTDICVVEEDDLQYVIAIHYEMLSTGLNMHVETIIVMDKYGCTIDSKCDED
jgi:hypothetical protein